MGIIKYTAKLKIPAKVRGGDKLTEPEGWVLSPAARQAMKPKEISLFFTRSRGQSFH